MVDDPHPHASGTSPSMRTAPPHPVRPSASSVSRAAVRARRRLRGSTRTGPEGSGRKEARVWKRGHGSVTSPCSSVPSAE